MKRSITFSLGAALLAIGLVAAWRQASEVRDEERALDALAAQRSKLTAKIQQARQLLSIAQTKQASLQTALANVESAARTAPADSGSSIPTARFSSYFERLRQDPKTQNLFLAEVRGHVATIYAAFFRTMHLSPDQVARFEDILAQHQEEMMDLDSVVAAKERSNDDPAVKKLRNESGLEYLAAMRALLGKAGYQQLEEYGRTVNARSVVSGWAGAATMAGNPLTTEQAEQLVQLLANNSGSFHQNDEGKLEEVDWNKIEEQTRLSLSASQRLLVKSAEPTFVIRLNQLIRAAKKTDATAISTSSEKAPGG